MNAEHCPDGYADPQRWCDWRNAALAGTGRMWVIGAGGTPAIVDDPVWSQHRSEREERDRNAERSRFNWRQDHPVSEEI